MNKSDTSTFLKQAPYLPTPPFLGLFSGKFLKLNNPIYKGEVQLCIKCVSKK